MVKLTFKLSLLNGNQIEKNNIILQNSINKLAETLHNLEELQIEIWSLHYLDSEHNMVELCRNNKNIKVLVFNDMVISEESCRAIADNCKKLEVLQIFFSKYKQKIYHRYLIY